MRCLALTICEEVAKTGSFAQAKPEYQSVINELTGHMNECLGGRRTSVQSRKTGA